MDPCLSNDIYYLYFKSSIFVTITIFFYMIFAFIINDPRIHIFVKVVIGLCSLVFSSFSITHFMDYISIRKKCKILIDTET